jgi:hypothetical protein
MVGNLLLNRCQFHGLSSQREVGTTAGDRRFYLTFTSLRNRAKSRLIFSVRQTLGRSLGGEIRQFLLVPPINRLSSSRSSGVPSLPQNFLGSDPCF